MRIGVDLRPLQTPSSAQRGIGYYTRHQISNVLRVDSANDYLLFFDRNLDRVSLSDFEDNLGIPDRDARWQWWPDRPTAVPVARGKERDRDERFLYTCHWELQSLAAKLDLFHVTSPWEWDVYVSNRYSFCRTVVTVYDLIPLVFYDHYLQSASPSFQEEFFERLRPLLEADRIIAISEATKRDVAKLLGIPETKIDVIYGSASDQFRVIDDPKVLQRVKQAFGLERYVMCVAGFHHTKNLPGIMEAFSLLPSGLREHYQLAVVCRLQPNEEQNLREMAQRLGIEHRLVLTNYVTEEDLVALYNGAELFLYPSFYEGFGLPVLEAMKCGAPVVVSNAASLPEVAGEAGILVDPYNAEDIAEAMTQVLSNPALRQAMREKGFQQAGKFSWRLAGQQTLQTYAKACQGIYAFPRRRRDKGLRIAYFSPLAPQKSGISDYSEELLPHLREYADIDIFVDGYRPTNEEIFDQFGIYDHRAYETLAEDRPYDVNLYQMGNSAFHEYIYNMVLSKPGVVVLHDFSLHGLVYHMTLARGNRAAYLAEVEFCEGKEARSEVERALSAGQLDFYTYPLNRRVITASRGLIVHNQWMLDQLSHLSDQLPIARINQGVSAQPPDPERRSRVRSQLGLTDGQFVIGCYGRIASTKRVDVVLRAFRRLLVEHPEAYLILVGDFEPDTRISIPQLIQSLGLLHHVRVTGYTDNECFKDYIEVADLCVNLRYPTAGETSRTLLQALAAGKPTLVSSVGPFLEYPDDCCWKVDVNGIEEELLLAYMRELMEDRMLRKQMGANARRYIMDNGFTWPDVARAYIEFLQRVIG